MVLEVALGDQAQTDFQTKFPTETVMPVLTETLRPFYAPEGDPVCCARAVLTL